MVVQTCQQRWKVLVVDDHPMMRSALASECQAVDCIIQTAGNGLEALQALDSFEPDVIVLDLHMPVMAGGEFARRYRARPNGRAAIILVSAEPELERLARSIGAVGWAPKQEAGSLRRALLSLLATAKVKA